MMCMCVMVVGIESVVMYCIISFRFAERGIRRHIKKHSELK